jgi:hypothetical protein
VLSVSVFGMPVAWLYWEEQKSGSRAAEASHIMTSYCAFITEQTMAKSYLFVLYNKKKNSEFFACT